MKKTCKILITVFLLLFLVKVVSYVCEEDMVKALNENRTKFLSDNDYSKLSASQKELIYTSINLGDNDYEEALLPLLASKIDDDSLELSVDRKEQGGNLVIYPKFQWLTEKNVNKDRFIFALISTDWEVVDSSKCTLYSENAEYQIERPSLVAFSGSVFELYGKGILGGKANLIIRELKENADRKILIGYVRQNKFSPILPIEFKLSLFKLPVQPGMQVKWKVVTF